MTDLNNDSSIILDEKKSVPEPEKVPPKVSTLKYTSLAETVNISSNITTDSGPNAYIDVIPDTRLLTRAIAYDLVRLYSSIPLKDNAYLTPLSFMAYCLTLTYTIHLHYDYEVRRPMSKYADEFMRNSRNAGFYSKLLKMKVPTFMIPYLASFKDANDPRLQNFSLIPTFACFSLKHDYPRVIPPIVFLSGHNVIASLPSNSSVGTINHNWYTSNVINHGTSSIQVGNILGTYFMHQNAPSHFPNWFNAAAQALFNPVVFRNVQNRPFLAPAPISPINEPNPTSNVNPYEYLLTTGSDNISNLTSMYESISGYFELNNIGSTSLIDVINASSSNNIFTHTISSLPTPTWHDKKLLESSSEIIQTQPPKTFASSVKYLQKTTLPANTLISSLPNSLSALITENKEIWQRMLYFISDSTEPSDQDYLLFDDNHNAPSVFYFDPYSYLPSKLFSTIVAGHKIESFEIDGFSVPIPNIDSSLRANNSLFLQSALPLSVIYDANDPVQNIRSRSRLQPHEQPVGVSLYDISINSFARLTANVVNNLPATLPGFISTSTVDNVSHIFNKFGFKIGTSPPIDPRKFHLWSSYRYASSTDPNLQTQVFMLASFRTHFGTFISLSSSEFPPSLIPT